jgi:hypothetical protein
MPSKINILSAKVIDGFRLNGRRRIFYHLGRPNFGDDINLWFFREISGSPFAWGGTGRTHVLGVGSIAAKVSSHSIVMGSGLIEPCQKNELVKPAELFSVRGNLTAELFDQEASFLGDPLCLIDLIMPQSADKSNGVLGVVPHVLNYNFFKNCFGSQPGVHVINPSDDPVQVVRTISGCRRIASQSLHGLIVADAYGIPNIWITPSAGMMGGTFKFLDYFTTLDKPKIPITLPDFNEDRENLDYTVGRYVYDKKAYLDTMKNRLANLPR